jgi:hypothetical protein
MSRLHNIPQSGPAALTERIARLERQMRSIRGHQARGMQSVRTFAEDEVIWPGSTGTWLDIEATVFVPDGSGLVQVAWAAELKQPAGGGIDVELRSDATFPARGGTSIPLEYGLSAPASYSWRTAPAISTDPGVSSGVIVEMEPGTRDVSIAMWSVNDIYIRRRNLWVAVL